MFPWSKVAYFPYCFVPWPLGSGPSLPACVGERLCVRLARQREEVTDSCTKTLSRFSPACDAHRPEVRWEVKGRRCPPPGGPSPCYSLLRFGDPTVGESHQGWGRHKIKGRRASCATKRNITNMASRSAMGMALFPPPLATPPDSNPSPKNAETKSCTVCFERSLR